MGYSPGTELIDDDVGKGLRLQGNTDGTLIGNSGNRLYTDAQVSPVPAVDVVYRNVHLMTSGGVENMNVNGSVTPVNFDFTPASGETWRVARIGLFLRDESVMRQHTTLGNIAALTNGIDLKVRSKGTEYTVANLKSNLDMFMLFKENDSYLTQSNGLGSDEVYVGQWHSRHHMVLQNSTSDYLRVTVRDNLTGLHSMFMQILIWRLL